MWCFVHFNLDMCFAPQRRALFWHLNFQKCSEREVSLVFSLANVLRTATACNFSSLIWPAGSAPAAVASLLFDPSEPPIIGKRSEWRPSYFFARLHLFLLTLSLLGSSLFSSPLWLFPPLLFHLSILSEVWLLNFLRLLYSSFLVPAGFIVLNYFSIFTYQLLNETLLLTCNRSDAKSCQPTVWVRIQRRPAFNRCKLLF